MSEQTEFAAIWAATLAVRKTLATAKDKRTVLGRMDPTGVAYHAALTAVDAYTETLAHEQARRAGGICANCGRVAAGEKP